MPEDAIRALLLKEEEGKIVANLTQVSEVDLPDGDVTVQID